MNVLAERVTGTDPCCNTRNYTNFTKALLTQRPLTYGLLLRISIIRVG